MHGRTVDADDDVESHDGRRQIGEIGDPGIEIAHEGVETERAQIGCARAFLEAIERDALDIGQSEELLERHRAVGVV